MNVTIVYKWGYDPDDAYIASDGSFRWKQGRLVPSGDDAQAVACARNLAEATGGTLRGATIGNGDATWAAARGAQELFITENALPSSDDLATARALRDVVSGAGTADVVVVADSIDSAGVAPALAALLEIPCVLGVRDFAIADDGKTIVAHRANSVGVELLEFSAPVLISVSAATSEKNVPTMKEMLAARKTPKEQVAAEATEESSVAVQSLVKAELKRARIFEGSPDEAATALVAALRTDGVL